MLFGATLRFRNGNLVRVKWQTICIGHFCHGTSVERQKDVPWEAELPNDSDEGRERNVN